MQRGKTGILKPASVSGRDFETFTPLDLPPSPNIQWDSELVLLLTRAASGAARLDGAAKLLPDLDLFLYTYIRKEAVLSSQIEGTQSSLSDLLLLESEVTPGVPADDTEEVFRYVRALNTGIERIRAGEALTVQLILDLHRILLSGGRGSQKDPGTVRTSQNWIGGATPDRSIFVPPPPEEVGHLLEKTFRYLSESKDHTLVKAALAHLQFESIHPFRDGNGRIGRLLVTLLLCQDKLISAPMVYLSLYLKENRGQYYDELQKVRMTGDWESWLLFFLRGVSEVTESAFALAQQIQALFERDADTIRLKGERKARGQMELYRALQQSPVLTISKASEILKDSVSKPTLYSAAESLSKMGILTTKVDEKGVQVHFYREYLELITSS